MRAGFKKGPRAEVRGPREKTDTRGEDLNYFRPRVARHEVRENAVTRDALDLYSALEPRPSALMLSASYVAPKSGSKRQRPVNVAPGDSTVPPICAQSR